MPWCPSCKMEYVEGIKICPDCKTALVAELSEEDNDADLNLASDEYDDFYNSDSDNDEAAEKKQMAMNDIVAMMKVKGISDEEIAGIIESAKRRASNILPPYKSISDKYADNKSASSVLLICGLAGLTFVFLNLFGIVDLPFKGYSKYLTSIVMGIMFLIFVFFGFRSISMTKKLKPMVEKEEKLIKKSVNYLKKAYKSNTLLPKDFDIESELSFEEQSLFISNCAMNALEKKFDDLPEGFSYYVVDRYYSDIFEEEYDLDDIEESSDN